MRFHYTSPTIEIHQSFEMTGKLHWHVQEKHASNHVEYNYTTLHQEEQIMYCHSLHATDQFQLLRFDKTFCLLQLLTILPSSCFSYDNCQPCSHFCFNIKSSCLHFYSRPSVYHGHQLTAHYYRTNQVIIHPSQHQPTSTSVSSS